MVTLKLLLPESAKVSLTLPCDRPFFLNPSLKGQVEQWGSESIHRKKGKEHRRRGGGRSRGDTNEYRTSGRAKPVGSTTWGTDLVCHPLDKLPSEDPSAPPLGTAVLFQLLDGPTQLGDPIQL